MVNPETPPSSECSAACKVHCVDREHNDKCREHQGADRCNVKRDQFNPDGNIATKVSENTKGSKTPRSEFNHHVAKTKRARRISPVALGRPLGVVLRPISVPAVLRADPGERSRPR